jgi:hypothetical protein
MNKPQGFDEALTFTGDFETIELGGHVCVIKGAKVETTQSGKEILKIQLDIAEGENKDFYNRQYSKRKELNPDAKWGGVYSQLTEGKSLPFFKGFIAAVENSNKGYKWNWDEATLKGKLFGGVFGEEEYISNDGTVKKATKCMQIKSVEQIRKGVEVPPLKTLPGNSSSVIDVQPIDDGAVPF